jgi:cysteine desulfurase
MKLTYFDYASASPVSNEVTEAMLPYLTKNYGNPSAIHILGREAMRALEEARSKVAALINGNGEEIIFTSGATESNNLAILGTALKNKGCGNHIITSKIEHVSVLNTCNYLEKEGFNVTYLPVDQYGLVKLHDVGKAISPKTILISIMHANNEIGTVQPIREIGKIARSHQIPFHVDAVASFGKIPIDVERDNIDLMTLSANEIYGPRGVGGLYVRKGTRIQPILYGGGQERKLRSGTENIAGAIGFGKAAEVAKETMSLESERLRKLRDKTVHSVLGRIDYSYLNGHPSRRIPTNVNIRFSFIEGESLLLNLDMEGIAAATGSACTSKTLEPSYVLIATGLKHEEAHGSLQLTYGRDTTEEDVNFLLQVLPGIVSRLRAMSPLAPS